MSTEAVETNTFERLSTRSPTCLQVALPNTVGFEGKRDLTEITRTKQQLTVSRNLVESRKIQERTRHGHSAEWSSGIDLVLLR